MRARDLSVLCAVFPLTVAVVGFAADPPKEVPASGSASAPVDSARPARRGRRDASAQRAEKEALADFEAANYGQADRLLRRELERCGTEQCSSWVRARLLITRGLVQSAGLRKADDAATSFEQALQADPQVTLPAGAPEETRKAFDDTRARLFPPEVPEVAPSPTPSVPDPVPPPVEVPIESLQSLGDARWTEIGFVRTGEAPAAPAGSVDSLGSPLALRPVSALRLDDVAVHLRGGWVDYVPINDGKTDDATDLGGLWVGLSVRPEWRSITSPVGVWLDFGMAITPRVKGAMQMPSSDNAFPTPMHGSLLHLGVGGQGGIDLVPIGFLSVGPLIGYHGDLYGFKLDDEMSVKSASSGGSDPFFDHGLDYGGHLRLRTAEKVGRPSVLFADAAMFHRKGRFLTGTYQRFEAGLQPGGDFSLLLFYQVRTGASGYVGLKDIKDPADALGSMMPVERVMGVGLGGLIPGGETEGAGSQ